MLCSSCQEIFKKARFIDPGVTETLGKNLHSTHTKTVRDAARGGCRICTMLFLHFDLGLESQPSGDLDLIYWTGAPLPEHNHKFDNTLIFRYKNQSRNGWVRVLELREENG
jgi:hypothetical protein